MTAARPFRLLVASPTQALPAPLAELVASGGAEVRCVSSPQEARDPALLSDAEVVVLCQPDGDPSRQMVDRAAFLLADALVTHHLMGIVLGPGGCGVVPGCGDVFIRLPADTSAEVLQGWLAAMRHMRPYLRRVGEQMTAMQRLGRRVNENLLEVDQELRLAGRLQRDFLPKTFPELPDMRFAAMFRPATWVSGDIYDVRQFDENHVGFFLADAMGHGVAAGLLTMFIKEAIVGRRVRDNQPVLASPSKVLTSLNGDLAAQELPNCQFVTACYGCVDTRSHEVTFARAGHPHPILVTASGACREVETSGGLLGVFAEGDFPSITLTLEPGDKLVLYSDGLEETVLAGRDKDGRACFGPAFLEAVHLPARECLDALGHHLDGAEGSLQPADDQSCLIIERVPT